jgi:hypothetical protein
MVMRLIINLTQHATTGEQRAAGVKDLPEEFREELLKLITFEEIPSPSEMRERAHRILALFERAGETLIQEENEGIAAMIGGAPFFSSTLEETFLKGGVSTLYAFSKRESVERILPDNTVRKESVFRHAGFVDPNDGFV